MSNAEFQVLPGVDFRHSARWLGYAGLIPFYTAGLFLLIDPDDSATLRAIQSYGAIILTFVGAIHWSRGMSRESSSLLAISVVPSLIAWMALFYPPAVGLPMLLVAFALLGVFDLNQYRDVPWFRTLRLRLTLLVCALLAFSWLISLGS